MKIKPATRWSAVAVLIAAAIVAPHQPAVAAPVACVAPVPSTTQPGYSVADPNCDLNGTPFQPLTDASGTPIEQDLHRHRERRRLPHGGAAALERRTRRLRARLPRQRARPCSSTTRRCAPHYVSKGFAWAASSYQTNGYDVGQGVRDSHALIAQFARRTRHAPPARSTWPARRWAGTSPPSRSSGSAARSSGAMPICGVLGDAELFDYFLDATVTAAALSRVPLQFPLQPPADFPTTFRTTVARRRCRRSASTSARRRR